MNFRFCVLKDELAWRVRDSVIALAHVCVCVCVFEGERRVENPGPEQSAARTSLYRPSR